MIRISKIDIALQFFLSYEAFYVHSLSLEDLDFPSIVSRQSDHGRCGPSVISHEGAVLDQQAVPSDIDESINVVPELRTGLDPFEIVEHNPHARATSPSSMTSLGREVQSLITVRAREQ